MADTPEQSSQGVAGADPRTATGAPLLHQQQSARPPSGYEYGSEATAGGGGQGPYQQPGAAPLAGYQYESSQQAWSNLPQGIVVQQTNGKAIASLVLGILWIWCIGSALALTLGYAARREIQQSRGAQGGAGIATAGIVLGWIGVGFFAFFLLVFLIGSV